MVVWLVLKLRCQLVKTASEVWRCRVSKKLRVSCFLWNVFDSQISTHQDTKYLIHESCVLKSSNVLPNPTPTPFSLKLYVTLIRPGWIPDGAAFKGWAAELCASESDAWKQREARHNGCRADSFSLLLSSKIPIWGNGEAVCLLGGV